MKASSTFWENSIFEYNNKLNAVNNYFAVYKVSRYDCLGAETVLFNVICKIVNIPFDREQKLP
jgi:hypothetical protein